MLAIVAAPVAASISIVQVCAPLALFSSSTLTALVPTTPSAVVSVQAPASPPRVISMASEAVIAPVSAVATV